MKKRLVKVISLLLCVILMLSAVPAAGAVLLNAPIDPFPLLPDSQRGTVKPVTPQPGKPSGSSSRPAVADPADWYTPSYEPEEASAGEAAEPEDREPAEPVAKPEEKPAEQPSGAVENPAGQTGGTEAQEESGIELPPIQVKIFHGTPDNPYSFAHAKTYKKILTEIIGKCRGRTVQVSLHTDFDELAKINVENTQLLIIIWPHNAIEENCAIAIRDYMEKGGGVWLNGEHEGMFAEQNKHISELSKFLKVFFALGEDTYIGEAELIADSPLGRANSFGNCTTVDLHAANSIITTDPTDPPDDTRPTPVPVITHDGKVYMIDADVEKGHLTVSADIQIIYVDSDITRWGTQIMYNILDRDYKDILLATIPHTPPEGMNLICTGEEQTLVTPGQVDEDKGTMYYSLNGTDWNTEPPKKAEAGTYPVYWKIDAKEGYKSIELEQVTATLTIPDSPYIAPRARNLTYNGQAQALIEGGYVAPGQGTMSYSLDEAEWSATPPTGVDAKVYPVYWKITAAAGYSNIGPRTLNAEIKPAALQCTPPTGQSLTYTGAPQSLCTAGSVTGGTMLYSLDNAAWSAAPPAESASGTYTVYWKAEPIANYTGGRSGSVQSTIAAQTMPEPQPAPRPSYTPVDTGSEPRYPVEVLEKAPPGGTVRTNLRSAAERDTVYIDAVPSSGYDLQSLTAVNEKGNSLPIKDLGRNRYSFKMSDCKVTVSAAFSPEKPRWNSGFTLCNQGSTCPIARFSDAQSAAWYHDGLHFCLENGLMAGVNDQILRPNAPISRAAFLSILWRLSGRPVVNYLLPFSDVPEDLWCAEAVRWAASEQLASGYRDGLFRPSATLTREQMAAILWRYAQHEGMAPSEVLSGDLSAFSDSGAVSDFAAPALGWACQAGLISGQTVNGRRVLNPQGTSSRAQAAAVIARYVKAPAQ